MKRQNYFKNPELSLGRLRPNRTSRDTGGFPQRPNPLSRNNYIQQLLTEFPEFGLADTRNLKHLLEALRFYLSELNQGLIVKNNICGQPTLFGHLLAGRS